MYTGSGQSQLLNTGTTSSVVMSTYAQVSIADRAWEVSVAGSVSVPAGGSATCDVSLTVTPTTVLPAV
jgi:hypothetical protein